MAVAQVFEKASMDVVGRHGALAVTGALTLSDALPRAFEPIAVPEPLAPLLPEGIRRGEALALPGDGPASAPASAATTTRTTRDSAFRSGNALGFAGFPPLSAPFGSAAVDYLTLALLAGALRQGLWCAAVGVRGFGGAALAGLLGAEALREGALQRLLVVAEPGERWAEITTVMADGVDLILLSPPDTVVPTQVTRRVDARLRQSAGDESRHRAALLVLGTWPSARTTLRVRRFGWTGFDTGTGHLVAGQAQIEAEDRTRRRRGVQVLLPEDLDAGAPLSPRARTADRDRTTLDTGLPLSARAWGADRDRTDLGAGLPLSARAWGADQDRTDLGAGTPLAAVDRSDQDQRADGKESVTSRLTTAA